MRIFATGVAGFIGSRWSELLLQEGHQVYGVDNMCPAYDIRLKDYRLERLQGQGRASRSTRRHLRHGLR